MPVAFTRVLFSSVLRTCRKQKCVCVCLIFYIYIYISLDIDKYILRNISIVLELYCKKVTEDVDPRFPWVDKWKSIFNQFKRADGDTACSLRVLSHGSAGPRTVVLLLLLCIRCLPSVYIFLQANDICPMLVRTKQIQQHVLVFFGVKANGAPRHRLEKCSCFHERVLFWGGEAFCPRVRAGLVTVKVPDFIFSSQGPQTPGRAACLLHLCTST